MDSRLLEAIASNDRGDFDNLVQENEGILEHRDYNSNTVLHLASRFRHFELVKYIIQLHPEMVATVNKKLESPLHEACRQGKADIVVLLLEINPWIATKLNYEDQSAFFIACRQGHLDVVKLMLNQSWLMDFEEDGVDLSALHVAALMGHTEIVKEMLEVRPNFAQKTNKNGFSPLHYACRKGHLEITRLLLTVDPDLALQYNHKGYTPLHLAAMHGKVEILEEFLLSSPISFQYQTNDGETPCHLAVKFNQYGALEYLAKFFMCSDLLLKQDQYGNTILHLAVSTGNYQAATYIINTTKENINCRNYKGHTALDILEQAQSSIESNRLKKALKAAGCERSTELTRLSPGVEETHFYQPKLQDSKDMLEMKNRSLLQYLIDIGNGSELPSEFKLGLQPELVSASSSSMTANSKKDSGEHQLKNKYESHDGSRSKQFLKEKLDMPTTRPRHKRISKSCGFLPASYLEPISAKDLLEIPSINKSEVRDDRPPEPVSLTEAKDLSNLKCSRMSTSGRQRRELNELFKSYHKKQRQYELYREALQNARNTIILVAILIATVTFTAGTNPPGGVFQEGPMKGKSTVGRTTAFKVFTISNNMALFTSLSIVIVLVSIIPFQRKQLLKMLVITHKVMWVAVSFMATAYVSATWVTLPHGRGTGWMLEVLLAISAGSLGTMFVYVGLTLTRHWLRKLEWRKEKGKKRREIATTQNKVQTRQNKTNGEGEVQTESSSTISDVDSSTSLGYHAY